MVTYYLLTAEQLKQFNLNSDDFSTIKYVDDLAVYVVPTSCVKLSDTDLLFKELLDNFDFSKVRSIMQLLEWKWYNKDIPSITDMIVAVTGLYTSLKYKIASGEYGFVATGGFRLSYHPEEKELSLVFEAVNYTVYGD